MPEKLEACVAKLKADGTPEESAWAICKRSMEMAKEGESDEDMIGRACEMAKKETYALKTYDLDGVEVFAVGEWNGMPFSAKDLDQIVDSFNKTKDRLKPYVKLGHNDKQPLLENDGLPAAGWVESLKRVGNKLVAKLSKVPAKIKDLIEAGAFRRVSVELIPKYRIGDEVHDMAMAGLALLGAKTPAVDTLDDIMALYGGAYQIVKCNAEAEVRVYTFDREAPETNRGEVMTEQEIKALRDELAGTKAELATATERFTKAEAKLKEVEGKEVKELSDKFSAAEKRVAELEGSLKSERERGDRAEADLAKFRAEKRHLEIVGKVEEFVRSKKLAPAQKDFAIALLEKGMAGGELEFSLGDKKFKSSDELLFAMIESGVGVTLNESAETGAGSAKRDDEKDGVLGVELDKKVKQYAKDNKVSYKEALIQVKRGA